MALAQAFALAVQAGRLACEHGLGAVSQQAVASSPLDPFLLRLMEDPA